MPTTIPTNPGNKGWVRVVRPPVFYCHHDHFLSTADGLSTTLRQQAPEASRAHPGGWRQTQLSCPSGPRLPEENLKTLAMVSCPSCLTQPSPYIRAVPRTGTEDPSHEPQESRTDSDMLPA